MNTKFLFVLLTIKIIIFLQVVAKADPITTTLKLNSTSISIDNHTILNGILYNNENNETIKQETINKTTNNDSNLIYVVNERETISLKCPIDFKDNNNKNLQLENYDSIVETSEIYDDEDIEDYDSSAYDANADDDDNDQDNKQDGQRSKRNNFKSNQHKLVIIQWYKDSSKINKFTFSNRFEPEGIYLKIKNVNLDDSGKYKCKLLNGFGSVSSVISLTVKKTNSSSVQSASASPKNLLTSSKKQLDSQRAPVFLNSERLQVHYFHKQKGSQVKFNCRASAVPKPDILWFKNGEILSEEDYGITRSKWTLDLKDLRMDDNGNFTCQVFNKYGYINSTFELIVYEDSQIFEGLDPLNSTITVGMDAVFNCKVKSSSIPNIKWMKQISKAEYANYVIQNSNNDNLIQSDESSNEKETDNDEFKSLYVLSTLPPLQVIEKKSNKNSNYDDSSLNDLLIGSDYNFNSNLKQDDFNFELFVPNESSEKNSKPIIKKPENKNEEDSIHYITLSSSPSISEKFTFNKEKNYYVSQLVIKQANIKDSGIYVCFGANTKGYSYRKSYLKVIPSLRPLQPSIYYQNELSSFYKLKELEALKTNNIYNSNDNKKIFTQTQSSSLTAIQSIGYFIIIVPVILISIFAIISVCYLKKLDNQAENSNKCSIIAMFKNLISKPNSKMTSKKGLFCCPANLTHVLIQNNYDDVIDKKQDTFGKNTLSTSSSSDNTNTLHCATTTLGSSLSDSSSTSATTVAYYATIPLLLDNNVPSSPPPLPNSQPPTFSPSFNSSQTTTLNTNYNKYINDSVVHEQNKCNLERTESTPSMAYYKIVDNEIIESNQVPQENDRQIVSNDYKFDDSAICASRFYYQIAPNANSFNNNNNRINNLNSNNMKSFSNNYQKNF